MIAVINGKIRRGRAVITRCIELHIKFSQFTFQPLTIGVVANSGYKRYFVLQTGKILNCISSDSTIRSLQFSDIGIIRNQRMG